MRQASSPAHHGAMTTIRLTAILSIALTLSLVAIDAAHAASIV
jgi:hypothetical protein